ncbi:MAG: S8/S53 family peptidase [Acidimicrobiia bacterium]|nr:S8/S53 family peptidase [Acidimicrobiia bacterium]
MAFVKRHLGLSLAIAGAVTVSAVVSVTPGPDGGSAGAAGPPCGPLGELVEYDLNDRCDFGTGGDPLDVDDGAVVGALRKASVFATTVRCRGRGRVAVVAAPDQLLIAGSNPDRVTAGLVLVRQRLDSAVGRVLPVNALATRVLLRSGTLTRAFMRDVVPTLQGRGFSVDLNYLEPAQPNNLFRPDDNPVETVAAAPGEGGQVSVLVLDSPAQADLYPKEPDVVLGPYGPAATYDVDGNGLVDEDHGHGVFVASLVKRLAPEASVALTGVNGRRIRGLARWSPMLFSDADLIGVMGDAFGLSPGGTAVRRGFHVVNMSLGGAGCVGIAARLPLGRFMRDLSEIATTTVDITPRYVAAAGNSGGAVHHYPAAWRSKATIENAADLVDQALGGGAPTPEGNEIRQIQAVLQVRIIAVGSWTRGVRDDFSNCGNWVNAIADGADAVSRYPSASSWASWSGTSFATARVSAVVAGGANPGDVATGAAIGAC